MNKHLAQMLDHVGLLLLHRKRSKQSHYVQLDDFQLIKLDGMSMFVPCSVPKISFDQQKAEQSYSIGKFAYHCSESNSHALGEYHLSGFHREAVNVILVHGWRMDSLAKLEKLFLKKFKQEKYNLFFVKLPHHFERAQNASYSGEHFISADVMGTVEHVRQAVMEIRALIQWIKHNEYGKVVLLGVSLGGYITNLVSVVEEKIDALVSVLYANKLSYAIWHTPVGRYIKQDIEQNGFTYEQLQQCWRMIEPEYWSPKLARDRILLLSGQYDCYVHGIDSQQLWQNWKRPERKNYPCGHAGIVLCKNKISTDVIRFMKKLAM